MFFFSVRSQWNFSHTKTAAYHFTYQDSCLDLCDIPLWSDQSSLNYRADDLIVFEVSRTAPGTIFKYECNNKRVTQKIQTFTWQFSTYSGSWHNERWSKNGIRLFSFILIYYWFWKLFSGQTIFSKMADDILRDVVDCDPLYHVCFHSALW